MLAWRQGYGGNGRMAPVPLQFCPTPRELDDLELLVTGALAPLRGFDEPGSPVTLTRPDGADGEVELVDPEGLPLATVSADGVVTALTHTQFGPFRRLYLTPEQTRSAYAGSTFVPVTGPLTTGQLSGLASHRRVVLLTLVGTGTPEDMSSVGLIRATLAAAGHLSDAHVVAVALASRDDAEADHRLGVQVVGNYAGPTRSWRWPTTTASSPTTSRPSSTSSAPTRSTRAWCCSSPACPAAASPPWPRP